jgi:protein-S-isoprenylcysteine O-methyltransferase Ste14
MESSEGTNLYKNSVHKILVRSYFSFFFFFLIGVCLDMVFNLKVFSSYLIMLLGVIFLLFGTFLIFWAQKTSRKLNKENINKETFCHGPYRYTRSPTHWGLFLLMLGFGLINNALFIVLSSIISFVVTKLVFLSKEEKILSEKYGAPYLEYKNSVKF